MAEAGINNNRRPDVFVSELIPEEDLIRLSREEGTGIELIRFSLASELERFPASLEEYEREVLPRLAGIPLLLHGPFLELNPGAWDPEIRRITMKRFSAAYRAAAALGAEKIVYHTAFHPDMNFLEGWSPRVSAFFREFLERQTEEARSGNDARDLPQAVLENVYDPYPEPLKEVWQQVGRPDFGLCLDIGHAHRFGRVPAEDWAKELLPAISHVHLHDNRGTEDEHLPLGKGTIRMPEVLSVLAEKEGLTYTVENRSPEDVRASLAVIRSLSGTQGQL